LKLLQKYPSNNLMKSNTNYKNKKQTRFSELMS